MIRKLRCANPDCRRSFIPDPRVKNQRYCGRKECRLFRRRRRQNLKMKEDPDYRRNQQESRRCWIEQNPDYYRSYRAHHPACQARNRLLQRIRDQRRRDLAKMDSSKPLYSVKPGCYNLVPVKADLAKMDSLSTRFFVIPYTFPHLAKKDSMDSIGFPAIECAKKEAANDGKNHPLSRPGP